MKKLVKKLEIFCDGGSRGNPGPAGIGVLINEIKISKYIGEATNNQAEYKAVIEALKWLVSNRISQIAENDIETNFYLDSRLVVEQLNQRYKLKNEGLKPLFWQIRDLIMKLGGKITFSYIPREQNKIADHLVNEAIDKGYK